ncbi:MAG: SDR family NAD(P)-dependent oxidoreductase [Bacteroidota bacterium]
MSTYFENRIVWITGASSGIGEALAGEFAARGATVLISSHEADELERVRKGLEAVSAKVFPVVFNLGNPDEVEATAKAVLEKYGRVDVLMNNGGISQRSLAVETPISLDRKIMEIDYFAGIILTKAVLPGMIERGFGHIGVTSSISGKFGFPLRSAYAAAKHALFGYYESVRAENSRYGVRVTLFSPGRVRTSISLHALEKDGRPHGKMDPGQARGIPPRTCARRMVRAMIANRKDVLVGSSELIMVYIHKYFRWLYYFASSRIKPE